MKKFLLWSFVIILLGLLGAVLARNEIACFAVKYGVSKATGFSLEIGEANVGLLDSQLSVNNLKLTNPPDFPDKMFVDLPEFHLSYELRSFFSGVPHVKELNINLKEVVIVKNSEGETNVQRLRGVQPSDSGQSLSVTDTTPEKPGSDKGSTKFQLDVAHVHIGTVVMKDYSKSKPTERSMKLDVDVTYTNITDTTDITRLALMTIMSQTHLPDLGIRMDDLRKGLNSVQSGAATTINSSKEIFNKIKTAVPKEKPIDGK